MKKFYKRVNSKRFTIENMATCLDTCFRISKDIAELRSLNSPVKSDIEQDESAGTAFGFCLILILFAFALPAFAKSPGFTRA